MVLRVLNYWRHVAGERRYPSVEDLSGDDVPELWENCFILKVKGDGNGSGESVLNYVGKELSMDTGGDLAGQTLSAVPDGTILNGALRHVGQVIEKGVPISMGGEFMNAQGERVLFRCIVLPLSDDDENIDHVFGAANARTVSAG
jgi:hypothetical protein